MDSHGGGKLSFPLQFIFYTIIELKRKRKTGKHKQFCKQFEI